MVEGIELSNEFIEKIRSLSFNFKNKERLELGSNAPSCYVSSKETGGLPSYIMSEGLLEKAEIDDIRLAVIEKEQSRKRKPPSIQKQRVEALTNLAHQTQPGKRSKAITEAIKEIGG